MDASEGAVNKQAARCRGCRRLRAMIITAALLNVGSPGLAQNADPQTAPTGVGAPAAGEAGTQIPAKSEAHAPSPPDPEQRNGSVKPQSESGLSWSGASGTATAASGCAP